MYSSQVAIDAKTMSHMARKLYLPACNDYLSFLAKEIKSCKEAGINAPSSTINTANKISNLIDQVESAVDKLDEAIKNNTSTGREKAIYSRDVLIPLMASLRTPVDELEDIVSKSYWPVPSYGDLLYHID